MFTLAGFVATARVSAEEMRRQKEEIMANIRWKYLLYCFNRHVKTRDIPGGWAARLSRLTSGTSA